MTDFLYYLGVLSLGGGAVVLLLWVAGRLTRTRCAARWRCWGWLLLCLRLALPFPLLPATSEQAPIQLPAPSDPVVYVPTMPALSPPAAISSSVSSQVETVTPSASQAAPTPVTLSQVLFWLWLAGFLTVLMWAFWQHLRFLAYLRRWGQVVEDRETLDLYRQVGGVLGLKRLPKLFQCPGLSVPMLAGIFRPVLLLPLEPMPPEELRCSLLHELTHFRRQDIPLKALGLWVTAVHWFNPAAWLMRRLLEQDTELACDEEALGRLSREERAVYGQTILAAAARLKGDASA